MNKKDITFDNYKLAKDNINNALLEVINVENIFHNSKYNSIKSDTEEIARELYKLSNKLNSIREELK